MLVRGGVGGHAAKTPTPARPAPASGGHPAAGPRLYTVKAGDTVTAIAAKTNVPLVRIRALNPSLKPTELFVGEKVRLR